MPDHLELAISMLSENFSNHSDALLASQIVSIAIQLSDNKSNEVSIASKMDLAAKLIVAAKKKISSEMIQS